MAVANEARVKLDRLGHQRTREGDEPIRYAATAQKNFRNFTLRFVDGIDADRRRPVVTDSIEPFESSEIDMIKCCDAHFSICEISSFTIPFANRVNVRIGQVSGHKFGVIDS